MRHPFTPTTWRDPATGQIDAGTEATVTFTGLHYDETCSVYIGTAHLKALVRVDEDADGVLDAVAFLGVNVHVESEADCS